VYIKYKSVIIIAVANLTFVPSALAQSSPSVSVCPDSGVYSVLCFPATRFSGVLGAIISLILALAVVIALFILLWGAVKWINSGGDKTMIESARGQIIGGATGLIVILLTFLILNLVLNFFGIDIGLINLPRLIN
jgi:hypothetical protein